MDDLFLILFFLSIVGLIIGTIKPQVVVRWGADKSRGKAILIFGITTLAFFILFGVTTEPKPKTQQPAPQQLTIEEIETQLREEGIKLALIAEVTEKNSIKATATTNLPDGVSLMFSADDDPKTFGMAQGSVLVMNGIATIELYSQGAKMGIYEIEVLFTPWNNAKVITDIVGKQGEQIEEIGVSEGTSRREGLSGLQITIIENSTSVTVEKEASVGKEPEEKIVMTDELAVETIKMLLKNNDVFVIETRVADGRTEGGVKMLILSYESKGKEKLTEETGHIVGAYLGAIKNGWDIDELAVIIGNRHGIAIGTWYCSESWTNDYIVFI